MPSSDAVLTRVISFIDKEGELVSVHKKTSTFDPVTQLTVDTYAGDDNIKAFVVGPTRDFFGNLQNVQIDYAVYVKGNSLSFSPKKDDRVIIDSINYQVIDLRRYRIRGAIVMIQILVKG